jgi:hypothetical protein
MSLEDGYKKPCPLIALFGHGAKSGLIRNALQSGPQPAKLNLWVHGPRITLDDERATNTRSTLAGGFFISSSSVAGPQYADHSAAVGF